ncbi:Glycoside hydrolase 2 (Mannanase, beta-galactosidase) [Hypoxylon texense]
MDNFPAEIISNIVAHLPDTGLAPFATISKKWRDPVERRTFAHLHITSKIKSMENFRSLVSPHRRTYLRAVEFTVVLPWGATTSSSPEELSYLQNTCKSHIHRLFEILAHFDDLDAAEGIRTGGSQGLTLTLGCIKPNVPRPIPRRLISPIGILDVGRDLVIPKVKCVSRLVYRTVNPSSPSPPKRRRLAVGAVVTLANLMPSLRRFDIIADVDMWYNEELNMFLHDPTLAYFSNKLNLTDALAKANYLSDTQCKEISLSMENSMDQSSIIHHIDYPDLFGCSIITGSETFHEWSHRLVSLDLFGAFHHLLFWPEDSECSDGFTFPKYPWPHLRRFYVKLVNWTPRREFYFSDNDASDNGVNPEDDELQPLFESWAKALTAMPVIEQATVTFGLIHEDREIGYTEWDWLVGFQAPGTNLDPARHPWAVNIGANLLKSPRLVFKTRGWRPDPTTMAQLCEAASKKFPGEDIAELDVDDHGQVTTANVYHT